MSFTTVRVVALVRESRALERRVIDIDEGDINCVTPLMMAAGLDHLQNVIILANKGADISAVDNSEFSALRFLVQQERRHPAQSGQAAVEGRRRPRSKTSTGGSSPLQHAAHHGQLGIVRVLIEARANPNRCI